MKLIWRLGTCRWNLRMPNLQWVAMTWLNSLAPGKSEWNFRYVIFKWNLVVAGWGISCEIALIGMSLDFTDDQSTLVQVMAWCRQATSHYLSQCWPRSLSPYGVTDTRPQWIKDSVSTSNMVVNSLRLCNAFLHRSPMSSLVQIITCCLFDTKPLSEPMLDYWWFDWLSRIYFSEIWIKKQ